MTATPWPDIHGSLPPFYNHPDRACRTTDPDVFFPTGGSDNGDRAKAICRRCPLRQECHDWAVGQPDLHGIWAGTSIRERKRERTANWTAAMLTAAGQQGIRRKSAARRQRIVALVAEGFDADHIADRIGCSTRTVCRHLAVARKMEAA